MDTIDRSSSVPPGTAYRYRSRTLEVVWHTSVPQDDEAAIAYFHAVTRHGREINPVFVERIVQNPEGGETVTTLDTIFDPTTNQTKPYSEFTF